MKRKDDTLAIFFVTVIAVLIWLWSATQTQDERTISRTLHFKSPEGSTSTISPSTKDVSLTFRGPRSSLNAAEEAALKGLDLFIASDDGKITIDVAARINALVRSWAAGAEVITADPNFLTLEVQTMVLVEAAVEPLLPSVTVSGDVTVNPATVMLSIPKELRSQLPEVVTVQAVVSETVLSQLQPGSVHTRDAAIQLPDSLDSRGINIEPNRVELSFKIQSKTDKATLPQVRVLIAGPAEDYAAYSVSLPVKIIPNVTIEADKDLIALITSGDVTVFALVRLASRDMEQRIESKRVTSFMAMLEDGSGVQVKATVEDTASLDVALEITPLPATTSP